MPQIQWKQAPKTGNLEVDDFTTRLYNVMFGAETGTTGILDSQNVDFKEPRQRETHTGTQIASTISDFNESVDDRVATLTVGGNALTITYNDAANTLTFDVDQTDNPGDLTIVTTETADNIYSSNERDMLNNLKTDVTNIIAKINLFIDNFQASGIVV